MSNLYVVRHGQTDYNVRKVLQGHIDIPLNEVGISQANEVSQKFTNVNVDVILTSPLSRARDTAKFISDVTGAEIEVDEGLIERSFGDLEGGTNRPDCNIEMMLDYNLNCDLYHIEPIQSLFERVRECIQRIIKKHNGKDIVLVTHAGVAQAIDCYFNGIPEDISKVRIGNCEIKRYLI